jgi:hypothetical protein
MDIADNGREKSADPATGILVAQMKGSRRTDKMLWEDLALAAIKQAFQDAAVGDYTALCWLVTEGRDWLAALGLSPGAVDHWGLALFAD